MPLSLAHRLNCRLAWGAGLILLSMLMHLLLLAWVDGALSGLGFGTQPDRPKAVQVALITPPASQPPAPSPQPPVPSKVEPETRAPSIKTEALPRRKSAPQAAALDLPPSVSPTAITSAQSPPPEPVVAVPISPEAFMGAAEPDAQLAGPAESGGAGVAQTEGRPESRADAAQPDANLQPPTLPAPPSGQWRFDVFFGEYREGYQVATLDYAIKLEGDRYELQTQGRATGLTAFFYSGVLTQSSAGRFTLAGLLPEHYAEQRGKRAKRTVRVDRSTGLVHFAGNEPARLVAGAQDRLSVLVQLGLMARAQPEKFVAGAVINLPEITPGDIAASSYTSHGDEVLPTRSGPLRALHLERTAPRSAEDNRIDLWLGYDQGLIPVRIRVTDVGGRVLDQLLARE